MMVAYHKQMTREAPFSMLKTDHVSGEQYVIRELLMVLLSYRTK